MMDSLISKEKLLESFRDVRWRTLPTKFPKETINETWVPWNDVVKIIMQQPTVDAIPVERVSEMIAEATITAINTAIPVEQVARIISRITWQPPCAFVSDPWINEQNEHCREYCGTDSDNILCFENALKEGWLDE